LLLESNNKIIKIKRDLAPSPAPSVGQESGLKKLKGAGVEEIRQKVV